MTDMCSKRYGCTRPGLKHRVVIALLLTGALLIGPGWTGQAWAQGKAARVGVLSFVAFSDDPNAEVVMKTFRQSLAKQGWIEGKNIAYEYRSANGDPARFDEAAAQLVGLDVDVIFATSAPALHAAFAATRTTPIVAGDFTTDPVAEGYVQSYGQPGGNVTGVFLDAPEFAGKWFELLRAMIPHLSRVAVLWDPGPGTTHLQAVRSAAGLLDIKLQVLEVRRPEDVDRAFSALHGRPQAVILLPSPTIYIQSARLASLAIKYKLPATSMAREFANAGGTLAYGPERASVWQRSAVLVAKILGGASPANIPVERPLKIQLVVNLKTAKALGITIPQSILLRADEVIR